MKKMIALMLAGVLLIGAAPVLAEDGIQAVKDAIPAVVVSAGYATGVSVATGGLLASMVEFTGLGLVAGGILIGAYRSWLTDPAREGKYRYEGQDTESSDRKWERTPGSLWMSLKAYDAPAEFAGLPVEVDDSKKWTRGPNGLMIKNRS